jgi:hypothetical protein
MPQTTQCHLMKTRKKSDINCHLSTCNGENWQVICCVSSTVPSCRQNSSCYNSNSSCSLAHHAQELYVHHIHYIIIAP